MKQPDNFCDFCSTEDGSVASVRPEDQIPQIPVPEHLQPILRTA